MPKPLLFVRVLLVLLVFCKAVQSQTPAESTRPVLFKEPAANQLFVLAPPTAHHLENSGKAGGSGIYFIKFSNIPGLQQQQQMAARGIVLHEYIPGNTYLATVPSTIRQQDLQQWGITGIFSPAASLKKEKEAFVPAAKRALAATARQAYHIWLAPGIDSAAAVRAIRTLLGSDAPAASETRVLYGRMLETRLSPPALEKLLEQPFVLYALPVPELFALNIIGTESHFGNLVHQGNGTVPGLTGKGITMGIGDAGRIYHIDHNYYEDGQLYNGNFHATHVAGTMAGKGHVNPIMRGFAYDARLEVEYFNNIIFQTPELYAQKRMVITNNSYGAGSFCLPYSGQYSGYCGQADQQLLDMPHLLHVFAAGNTGTLTCGEYPVSYRTIDNAFQAAKNILTVGGTNEAGSASVYSKGPTLDGRVKPEIVAVSTNVFSTATNNGYGRLDGTSMASPQVSGALALLYERYRQLFNGDDPDGALMKALVCNTATDLGTKYVDFANGFGWLNIRKAVETMNAKNWFSGRLQHQQEQRFEINLDREVADFKIMLYWHDQPPSYYSSLALVNDLDITVQLPDGSIYDPFVLDTSATGVLKQATRAKDHLNNIEQVVIDRALPGRYQVIIKGYEVPLGPQNFYVVYNWEELSFDLLQPAGGELYKQGDRRVIHWRYPGHEADSYQFFFSTNGGISWTTIYGAAALSNRNSWTIPSITNNRVLVKIVHQPSGQERISAPFSILPEPVFSVSSDCESKIKVEWKKPASIDSVAVLLYNGTEMETIQYSSDTVYQIQQLKPGKPYWVSIRPILQGKLGLPAIAKRILTRPVICPVPGMNNDLSIQVTDSLLVSRSPSARDSLLPFTVQLRNEGSSIITDTVFLVLLKNGLPIAADTLVRNFPGGQTVTWTTKLRPVGNLGETARFELKISTLTDPNPTNNSSAINWRYVGTSPLTLPFTENLNEIKDTIYRNPGYSALVGLPAWDLLLNTAALELQTKTSKGFFINSKIEDQSVQLIGNYNFANYNVDDNIGMSIDIPDFPLAKVDCFIRGNDTSSWLGIALSDPLTQQPQIDFLNISNVLKKGHQEFSASFQVRLRVVHSSYQQLLHVFRKIQFFKAEEDIRLVYLTYQKERVTDGDTIGISLYAANNKQSASKPVLFSLQSPDQIIQQVEFPSIAGGDTAIVNFRLPVNNWPAALARVKAWVAAEGDPYRADDSLSVNLAYARKIERFPYLEGFESGKAGWGSTFLYEHSSQLGASIAPYKPANGKFFWGTQWISSIQGIGFIIPSGYLLSPLFDLRGLAQPYFSASVNKQLCDNRDSVFMEYSLDTGKVWLPLKTVAPQVNWYTNAEQTAWIGCGLPGYDRWRVISSALPAGASSIQFRLMSLGRNDAATIMPRTPGGLLLDDFHVYSRNYPLFNGTKKQTKNSSVYKDSFSQVLADGQLMAELKSGQEGTHSVQFTYAPIEGMADFSGNKVLPFNWVLQGADAYADTSARFRFYIPDETVQAWLDANPCDTCTQKLSAYDLSVFRYAGPVSTLNQQISDNVPGYETIWDPAGFELVPYDNGYYVELSTALYGEFYLGRNTRNAPVQFSALRSGNEPAARLSWSVTDWQGVVKLELERSNNRDAGFLPIFSNAISESSALSASFLDNSIEVPGTYFYRLKLVDNRGGVRYSVIRVVQFDASLQAVVYPNPGRGDQLKLQLTRLDGAKLELELVDMSGKQLSQSSITVGPGQHWVSLASITKGRPAGVYILKLRTGQQKKALRLVISGN
ncbi:S8 family serine peptidase [Flavihumibacter sp. CACIAM 22H1]|uniref:S8 family serine peptidase n=1 Tax=Flavihumibacter sp. CACIAM 22H1 TaxID=1812911 RepID=UPI000A509A69|nr:S8 family serine peptidase [Flavihumibacter sp. CACIAM 22H1]